MRRMRGNVFTKRAMTLVELVVAMALTLLFASACIMLIYPVSRIYTHVNETSRAQMVADNVIGSLRAECARTYISAHDDVWISPSITTAYTITTAPLVEVQGPVLVIRRNYDHCETIASDYSLRDDAFNAYNAVYEAEQTALGSDGAPQTGTGGSAASRAVYRMFDPAGDPEFRNTNAGYVHYGYFEMDPNASGRVNPTKYYDFTNPLPFAMYGDYTVELNFHGLQYTTDSLGNVPAFVLCDVSVVRNSRAVYTRENVVLCFASAAGVSAVAPTTAP